MDYFSSIENSLIKLFTKESHLKLNRTCSIIKCCHQGEKNPTSSFYFKSICNSKKIIWKAIEKKGKNFKVFPQTQFLSFWSPDFNPRYWKENTLHSWCTPWWRWGKVREGEAIKHFPPPKVKDGRDEREWTTPEWDFITYPETCVPFLSPVHKIEFDFVTEVLNTPNMICLIFK